MESIACGRTEKRHVLQNVKRICDIMITLTAASMFAGDSSFGPESMEMMLSRIVSTCSRKKMVKGEVTNRHGQLFPGTPNGAQPQHKPPMDVQGLLCPCK